MSAAAQHLELERFVRLADRKRLSAETGPSEEFTRTRATEAIAYELGALRILVGQLVGSTPAGALQLERQLRAHLTRIDRAAAAELGDAESAGVQDHARPTGPVSGVPAVSTYAGLRWLVRGLAELEVGAVLGTWSLGRTRLPSAGESMAAAEQLQKLVDFAIAWNLELERREHVPS